MLTINHNPNVTEMSNYLLAIRAAVKGPYFIKKIPSLLPHPSAIDTTSDKAVARYKMYSDNADFDSFPKVTLASWIGQMDISSTETILPEKLEYLRDDVDNDRLSINGLLSSSAANILQVKWHILLSDYNGLPDVDTGNVSMSDAEKLNQRATIKQYSRENVVDWDFARINGRMQLTYILLREISSEVNHDTMARESVTSYLKLAVDELGYYQQKYIDNTAGEEGERNYVKVDDASLMFIPIEIVCDEELQGGEMPMAGGAISPVVDVALSRFKMSAIYKEFMMALVPTKNIFGLNQTAWETFKEVNGRDYISSGAFVPNIFPADVAMEVTSSDSTSESFIKDFEMSERQARAAGAVFNGDSETLRTATEVVEQSKQQSNLLLPVVQSLESGLTRCIAYCGMFEGLYKQDDLSKAYDDIIVDMPSDFAVAKISVEEAKEMRESVMAGLLPHKTYLKALKIGGWEIGDIDEELALLASAAPIV